MKSYLFSLSLFTFLCLVFTTPNIEGQSIDANNRGAIQLFNGSNLDGWYTFIKDRGVHTDPLKVFTVVDGMIRISGEEWGCITSIEEFENYQLLIEFRWGEKTFGSRTEAARDSGVLLHSIGKDGAFGGTWMNSIECQLIEGGTGDFIVVGDGTNQFSLSSTVASEKQGSSNVFKLKGKPVTITGGRLNWYGRDPNWKDVKGFRGVDDVENPVGEWNNLKCVVKNGEIAIYLNGKLVNKAFDVKPSKGRIQIQSEGAEIFFRRVELVPIK